MPFCFSSATFRCPWFSSRIRRSSSSYFRFSSAFRAARAALQHLLLQLPHLLALGFQDLSKLAGLIVLIRLLLHLLVPALTLVLLCKKPLLCPFLLLPFSAQDLLAQLLRLLPMRLPLLLCRLRSVWWARRRRLVRVRLSNRRQCRRNLQAQRRTRPTHQCCR